MNCSSHQHPHDASTSSFHDILEISSMTMNNKKVNESKKKILDLTKQIEHAELINKTISTTTTSIQQQQQNQYDWTNTYQYWNKWEDIDELKLQKENEASRLNNFIEENNFMGHCNDHTEERKFFELPENEKLLYCERHRLLGNYLYSEGMLPKAAEQYQLALSYYEYCFPESESDQHKLDVLRHACLCNISLCFLKMGYTREAEDRASQAITEAERRDGYFDTELIAKSYYRRAQARRHLDEYETALSDIEQVLRLCPEDSNAIHEKFTIQKLISNYEKASHKMAAIMLGTQTVSSDSLGINQQQSSLLEELRDEHLPALNFDLPLEPNLFYHS